MVAILISQTGGVNNPGELELGVIGGTGTYTLTGGTLLAGSVSAGLFAKGNFIQKGGAATMSVVGDGDQVGGNGTMALSSSASFHVILMNELETAESNTHSIRRVPEHHRSCLRWKWNNRVRHWLTHGRQLEGA